jgi:hypothetical protein
MSNPDTNERANWDEVFDVVKTDIETWPDWFAPHRVRLGKIRQSQSTKKPPRKVKNGPTTGQPGLMSPVESEPQT